MAELPPPGFSERVPATKLSSPSRKFVNHHLSKSEVRLHPVCCLLPGIADLYSGTYVRGCCVFVVEQSTESSALCDRDWGLQTVILFTSRLAARSEACICAAHS